MVSNRYGESSVSAAQDSYRTRTATDIVVRTDEQFAALFGNLTLIERSLVPLNDWRFELGDPGPYDSAATPSPMRGAVTFRF